MARSDIHRAGAIIPEDYSYCFSYALPTMEGGWPVPPFNIDMVVALRTNGAKFAEHGGLGKCTACGAAFKYGDVWRHDGTGEHIHLGHDCADKYELLADRSDLDRAMVTGRAATAAARLKAEKEEAKKEFLASFPGLAEAFEVAKDHNIVKDIAARLDTWGSVSDKTVALVLKLADEIRNPRPAEVHVPAPEGRTTVRGTVVSVKAYDTDFGTTLKMTVKVATPEGTWLAWGTVPASILDALGAGGEHLKGKAVEFTATLKRGRDSHFAIFSRPTKGSIINETSKEVA